MKFDLEAMYKSPGSTVYYNKKNYYFIYDTGLNVLYICVKFIYKYTHIIKYEFIYSLVSAGIFMERAELGNILLNQGKILVKAWYR